MNRTKEALSRAFAGEAKAVVRLRVFARKAEEEGYRQIAKLFRVIAFSEEIHAARAMQLLKEVGETQENLAASFEAETKVAGVGYDQFIKTAEEEQDRAASLFFSQSRDVEDVHAKLYKEAMGHLMAEREVDYFVCNLCGYVADQSRPDECPVCGAPAEDFVTFSQ